MPITILKDSAPEIEHIKQDFADYIGGLNSADGLSYYHYSKIFFYVMDIIESAHELGKRHSLTNDAADTRKSGG